MPSDNTIKTAKTNAVTYPPCIATDFCDANNINWLHGKIKKIYVRCSKESSLSGLSEVSVVSFATYTGNINPYTGQSHPPKWVGDPDYRKIGKISGYSCSTTYDWMLYQGWRMGGQNVPNETQATGNLLFYVIFEYGPWPAGIKF